VRRSGLDAQHRLRCIDLPGEKQHFRVQALDLREQHLGT